MYNFTLFFCFSKPVKIVFIFSENGKIEYGEFRNFMMKQYKEQNTDIDSEKQIRQAFKVFDRDGNGCIDKKELR